MGMRGFLCCTTKKTKKTVMISRKMKKIKLKLENGIRNVYSCINNAVIMIPLERGG